MIGLLCAAIVPCGAESAEPPTKVDGSEVRPPARVEKLVIRDTLQADGGTARAIEAVVFLNDAVGVSQFGQVGAPYIEGYGEVLFDEILIQKADGRRVDVRDTLAEDINPLGLSAAPVPADFRIRRVTVPGLVPGDRLSYRVAIRHKPLFPNVAFGEFTFDRIPGLSRPVYELDSPAELQLSIRRRPMLTAQWEEVPAAPGRRLRRLTLSSAPAAQPDGPDAGVAPEPDVQFTTFKSWDELGRWWWALARERFLADEAVRAEAARLVAGREDVGSRVFALHEFVAGQIRYLSVGFGSGRFQPRPAAEVLSTRYADCKGKHGLLAALASAFGVEVWPVLVHTARKDLADDVPSPGQFDHLISVVKVGADPSQWLWVDATMDLALPGYLMPNIRGKRALLVDEKGGHVVTVPDRAPFATRQVVENRATLEATGPLKARVRWTVRGDAEPWMRAAIRLAPREKWTELGKGLAEEWSKGVVSDVTAAEPTDLRHPFWIEYAVVHNMTSKTFEKDWTLWVPLPDFDLPKSQAKEGERAAPAELKLLRLDDETILRGEVEMPEGMKARPPLSVSLERPFGSYRSTYKVEGRRLFVERVLQLRQRTIGSDQVGAYEAFRAAVAADRKQEFQIEALTGAAAESLQTADALNAAGLAALEDRHEAEAATTLFRRAVERDPRHKWAWNNLGRALRELAKPDEALKAFDRQIEINPYDEYAYGNRGATFLFDLNRPADAEKDLLKQMEITPLDADAYRDLAHLRMRQERFPEAADLLERASAAEPSSKTVWLSLAWARARAGRGGVAEAAQRARALDNSPRAAIIAARAVAAAGDRKTAAEIAKEALPRLIAALEPTAEGRRNEEQALRDHLYVAETWRLIGAAALEAGDADTADRYLRASWLLGSTPDTAADLGRLRERQGRLTEAIEVWQHGSFLPVWRGNPAKRELERVVTDERKRGQLLEKAARDLAMRQIQELPGPPLTSSVEVRVRLVVDEHGRILDVGAIRSVDQDRVGSLRDRVIAARIPAASPDESKFKLLRSGTVTCFPQFGCKLGLALFGDEVMRVLER